MRYVIIGGSIAGIAAAKAIGRLDASSEVSIISLEKTKPYYRPMIPFLIKKDEIDITFEDDLGQYDITFVYEKAAGISARSKEVILSTGREIGFDRLLIATGSSPLVPALPNIGGKGVFTLRTMEDALRIKRYIKGRKKAVVMGGGLVGLKTAIALSETGIEVTIVEKKRQLLPLRLDRRGAGIISNIVRDEGIRVLTGESPSEVIRSRGALKGVRLSSGDVIDAEILIVAVGTRPNIDLVKDAGIITDRAILTDESLQTSRPDIYAAGDVVEFTDILTGMPAVSALWTNAEEMGRIAGKNMAGAGLKYRGFLSVMNSTEIFKVPVMSIGLVEPDEGAFDVVVSDDIDSYRKLVFNGDILVGAVFIGEVANAGIYTSLIRNSLPMGGLKEAASKGNLSYINFIRTLPAQRLTT